MKIIITGGTGFIGHNLINHLDLEKNKVYLISRKKILNKNFEVIRCSLENFEKKLQYIKKIEPDLLIHLAWGGIPDYSQKNSEQNYHIQKKFFKEVKKIKSITKIIVTGTCAEYKNQTGKVGEKSNISSNNFLGFYKTKIYNYLKKNFSKKVKIVWLRLFYVYGYSQRKDALIPYIIESIKKNKKIFFKKPTEGKDYINVQDVCQSIVFFSENKISGIFNVGTGKAYNPNQIYKMICKSLKIKIKIPNKMVEKNSNFIANIKKIEKKGWSPKLKLVNEIKNYL